MGRPLEMRFLEVLIYSDNAIVDFAKAAWAATSMKTMIPEVSSCTKLWESNWFCGISLTMARKYTLRALPFPFFAMPQLSSN
jgi:hypothetical protein